MRVRLMQDLNRFAAEEEVLLIGDVNIRGPRGAGRGRRFAILAAHAVENLLRGDHSRAFTRAFADIALYIAAVMVLPAFAIFSLPPM